MWRLWTICTVFVIFPSWKALSQNTEISPDQICAGGQDSCRDCLLLSPFCSWCADNRTAATSRCRLTGSRADQCAPGFRQNPQGSVAFTRDEDFSNVEDYEANAIAQEGTQLRPQGVNVKLRQGKPERVNITFRRVFDYPLDLYYVMDLSYSMQDDLQTLQALGSSLAQQIQSITSNTRLGFGTFVDKVMMPYASTVPDQLQDPCLNIDNATCAPVFGFRHQLSITSDGDAFRDAVRSTVISGNIDTPEGGFDALMQIAVCQDLIEWRENALRVVVFTTDASSHIAMDGKLAAILEINDMKCHLGRNAHPFIPDAVVYTESKTMDYPSIGQLRKVFDENKIQPIFAVTEDVLPLYEGLKGLLGRNAFVAALNNDSSNVVPVIRTSYNILRNQIHLNPPTNIPDNVDVSYRVLCPDRDWVEGSLSCDNVEIDDEATFQFILTANACPLTPDHVDTINITSGSILDTTSISLEYVSCSCDCDSEKVENSPSCSNDGTLQCGICTCNPGASGEQCQCTASTTGQALEQNCTTDDYQPGVELCNSQGSCVCGICSCADTYYGDYCECRRTGCPDDCGGPLQGICQNCNNDQNCVCNTTAGFYLNEVTRSCTCNNNKCRRNATDLVCSGNGVCDCDRCDCEPRFDGLFCQTCIHPSCTGLIGDCNGVQLKRCAECVYEEDRAEGVPTTQCQEVCQDENILFDVVDELLDCNSCFGEGCTTCNSLSRDPEIHIPQECTDTSEENGCDFSYKIFWNTRLNQFQIQVRKFDNERDCPGPVNPLLIVLPVVGGIVLLGLIALILWKIFQTIRDKNEYQQFLEDTKHSDWSKGVNPLFNKPTERVENPAFIGTS